MRRLLTAELLSSVPQSEASSRISIKPCYQRRRFMCGRLPVPSYCILDYHTHTHQSAAWHKWADVFSRKQAPDACILPDRSENKAARPRPFLHPPPLSRCLPRCLPDFWPLFLSPHHPHHLGHGTHVNQALNPEQTCRVASRPTV